MTVHSDIVRKAGYHVRMLFQKQQSYPGLYHNYDHTVEVVNNAAEIAAAMKIEKAETEILLLAAWFHDTGYLESPQEHEERSMNIAAQFLSGQSYPQKKTDRVVACIRATKLPQQPNDLLEKVMCDADLLNLGKKGSLEKGELLRLENESMNDLRMSEEEWLRQSISFYKDHQYHTTYAIQKYSERRDRNLRKLRKRLQKLETRSVHEVHPDRTKALKEKRPGRGIETMFRIASQNHMELSSIADNKANIMISVPSIIISIVTTVLLRRLNESPELLVPTFMLILTCVATIVFAILSTRPKVTSGKFSRDEIKAKRINLLFFGNFFGMEYDDYRWGMNELMKDKDLLYDTMIKDIYYLGQVLGKKYRFLRISYNIFLYGLVASVLAYSAAFIMYGFYL
jgi:predicted metal-dependent HD superfamily phosphohydrolase